MNNSGSKETDKKLPYSRMEAFEIAKKIACASSYNKGEDITKESEELLKCILENNKNDDDFLNGLIIEVYYDDIINIKTRGRAPNNKGFASKLSKGKRLCKFPKDIRSFLEWGRRISKRHKRLTSSRLQTPPKGTDLFYKEVFKILNVRFGLKHSPKKEAIESKKIELFKEKLRDSNELVHLQREIRRDQRLNLHGDIFEEEPRTEICLKEYWERFIGVVEFINHKKLIATEIKHYTTLNNLKSIILSNFLLYGAKNLRDIGINYDSTSLQDYDVKNGDGNVICFGTDNIDAASRSAVCVKIKINLKDIEDVPNCFCKIVDFGFNTKQTRSVMIDEWTMTVSLNQPEDSYAEQAVIFKNKKSGREVVADLHPLTHKAIFYNARQINAFFASYIFEVIDLTFDKNLKEDIKKEFLKLSNEGKLVDKLVEIGKAISFCNEVNFSGAFTIDYTKAQIILLKEDEKGVKKEIKIEPGDIDQILRSRDRGKAIDDLFAKHGFRLPERGIGCINSRTIH